jgi:hypothetical protein
MGGLYFPLICTGEGVWLGPWLRCPTVTFWAINKRFAVFADMSSPADVCFRLSRETTLYKLSITFCTVLKGEMKISLGTQVLYTLVPNFIGFIWNFEFDLFAVVLLRHLFSGYSSLLGCYTVVFSSLTSGSLDKLVPFKEKFLTHVPLVFVLVLILMCLPCTIVNCECSESVMGKARF